MKKWLVIGLALAIIFMSNCTFSATPASAKPVDESVSVSDPYVRAVPPGQTISAAFMRLQNHSDDNRMLVKVSSSVARVVELHTHTSEEGMMKMRRIDSISIAAGSETILKPGGLHIMLIGLQERLIPEQDVSLTLTFDDGSSQTVAAPVRKIRMQDLMKHH